MKSLMSVFAILVFVAACSSRSFKRDYEVVDASHQEVPEWVNEPREWAQDEDEDDFEKHRYYIYTTDAKNSRTMACEAAKARAASVIASEISQFIKQSFATSTHGDPRAMDPDLSSYMEESLAKEVQSFVVGAKTLRTYWEKRRYLKDKGAKKDYDGYVCSALLKVSKGNLDTAFNRANQKLTQKAQTGEAKAKVSKAIEDAQKAFQEN